MSLVLLENFDLDVGIARIYIYIKESSVKLAVNSAEKSLKVNFAIELSSCMSSMYKKSSEAKELTQIRKTTAEKYSENTIHILCVYKKLTDEFSVIWVSMIDLEKRLDLQSLCCLTTAKR